MNDMSMIPPGLIFSDSAADKVKALIVEEGNDASQAHWIMKVRLLRGQAPDLLGGPKFFQR